MMSQAEREDIAAALDEHEASTTPPMSFREFLTSPEYCGQRPSPMVAAIVDASEGRRPTTISDEECERYFGCSLDELPTTPRRTICGQAGGRGGKTSRLLAPKALHAAWTVPLPTLMHNEHAVSLIISSELAFARQALSFCTGYVEASPVLSRALVGRPGKDRLTLRRPDGKLVDVRVRAAGARGTGGRSFTLAGAFFDEAAFFYDESGVVNDKEIYRACSPRVVPGGQLWMLSTPWIDGVGLLESKIAENWGSHDEALCFRRVSTHALNPTFDPDGTIEAEERRDDPENWDREILAIPMVAGTMQFFSREALESMFDASLPQITPPEPGMDCVAGGDTGFTQNSSALAIVQRLEQNDGESPPLFRLNRIEERKPEPGLPLIPKDVAHDFADIFVPYGTHEFVTDTHEITEVSDALAEKGCTAILAPDPHDAFIAARTVIHEGRARAPFNARLRTQLRSVVSKPMPGGGKRIHIPRKKDGSHGDIATAYVRALWMAQRPAAAAPPPPPRVDPDDFEERHLGAFAGR